MKRPLWLLILFALTTMLAFALSNCKGESDGNGGDGASVFADQNSGNLNFSSDGTTANGNSGAGMRVDMSTSNGNANSYITGLNASGNYVGLSSTMRATTYVEQRVYDSVANNSTGGTNDGHGFFLDGFVRMPGGSGQGTVTESVSGSTATGNPGWGGFVVGGVTHDGIGSFVFGSSGRKPIYPTNTVALDLDLVIVVP